MPYRTTPTNSIKCWKHPLTWVKSAVAAVTRELFAPSDARARQHGWQVTSIQHGFGRRYRDPRFDSLARCSACQGRGVQALGTECVSCRGIGRVVIELDARSSSDRPSGWQA